jgi:penicillin-binding protein 2B
MKKITRKMKAANPLRNRKIIAVFLYIISFVLFGILGFRFSWIMVRGEINGENLLENVHELYTSSNTLQASRGTIYDANGNPIALDATSYKLIAILTDAWSSGSRPQHVQDPQAVAKVLAEYLSMSEEDLLDRLTRDSAQVEFGTAGNNLPYDIVRHIQEELDGQGLTGIHFEEKQTRLYPNGTFASHTIGLAQHVDVDEEDIPDSQLTGVMGLESSFDEYLRGVNGSREYQRDRFGYVLPGQEAEQVDPVNGQDIHLTLDRRLQIYLENVLEEVDNEHSPEAMTATLMNAKTGEIIAAAQRPSFNATTLEGIDGTWQNLLTEYTYEPGSTMKVMTLAAAIEEGTFRPHDTFRSGRIQVGGGTVHDFNPDGWGTISYLEGLARSSNVAFVRQVEEMGHDRWKEYLDNFGFGEPVGIGLPNEAAGNNPYEWPLQRINTGFGQGIAVTPVQMLRAFSAIANGGQMVQPYIVESIRNPETGEETTFEPEITQSMISESSADLALEYLKETVYSDVGTARGYNIDGYEIAAKTGTAQLVNPETGNYYSGGSDYIYSVVGMAPADDPELILYVTVQQPTLTESASHGSQVVQKVFNPVMRRALEYNRLGEEAEESNVFASMPNFIDENTHDAIQQAEEVGLTPAVIGSGENVVQQYPQAETQLLDSGRMILLTNGAMTLPDMTGWSRNDALKIAELTGVEFTFEGEGFVVNQELEPDSFIEAGDRVAITLAPPGEEQSEEDAEE